MTSAPAMSSDRLLIQYGNNQLLKGKTSSLVLTIDMPSEYVEQQVTPVIG